MLKLNNKLIFIILEGAILKEGLYEQVINKEILQQLENIEDRKSVV